MANSKISILIDVAVDKANRSLKSFRQSVKEADTATGKFKAGASSAFSGIQANAGEFALAAGAALVAFGVKSVAAFKDTALAAGQMRDSLGVTAEEASRLIEVAEDLGIGADTLEKSIGIMNRTATNTPGHFAAIGAELVKNADGTTNVNETFLSTIDALNKIPDASARAAAAQKVFGRGWMEMSELIGLGAEGVRKALDSVEGGKIIDDKEVERARKFRDSLDTLKGTVEELQVEIGSGLVPVLTDVIDSVVRTKTVISDLADTVPGLGKAFELVSDNAARIVFWPKYILDAKDALTETTETVGTLGESITAFEAVNSVSAQAYVDHAKGMQAETKKVADENEEATARIERAWDDLSRELSDRSAYLDIEDALDDLEVAYMTAMDTAGKSLAEQEADARNVERAQIDLKSRVAEYAEEIALLPPERATQIMALIDEGNIAEVERRLATLEKIRIARITPEVYMPSTRGNVRYRAGGGVVGAGETTVVGENGPEIAQFPAGTRIHPTGTGPSGGASSGGGVTNVYNSITIHTTSPEETVAAIKKYSRRNGPGSVPL